MMRNREILGAILPEKKVEHDRNLKWDPEHRFNINVSPPTYPLNQ